MISRKSDKNLKNYNTGYVPQTNEERGVIDL